MFRLILVLCLSATSLAAQRLTFDHNGTERHYYLHIPEDLPANAPLVLALHWLNGNAQQFSSATALNYLADSEGFVALYPEGLPVEGRYTSHWNAGLDFSEVDDLGYLTALVADVQKSQGLDTARTFVFGMSNGGYMTYTLACRATGLFAAFANVTGTMGRQDRDTCAPDLPTSILHIHGTNDQVIPYDGVPIGNEGWGGGGSVPEVVDFWVQHIQADAADTLETQPKTEIFTYANAESGHRVRHYKINGFGHNWPNRANAGFPTMEIIWRFFATSPPLTR
ncbi:MAG: polyhydroxybutyrate depolymerase [Rhodobacteraceae bacterium]|nr:polyhydroxybutyrate depolymerase [Paracoccaceae bacterium]